MDIKDLKYAFDFSWDTDTAHGDWHPSNRSKNQCAPTALIVQDYFGGALFEIKLGRAKHFVNIIDSVLVDFTAGQFRDGEYPDMSNPRHRGRNDLLRVKHIKQRYEVLKERVEQWLE